MPHTPYELQTIFEHGWRDAEDGMALAANPYLRDDGTERLAAWLEGYRECVDGIGAVYRERLVQEGRRAAVLRLDGQSCPYLSDRSDRRSEIWLTGHDASGVDRS